MANAGKFESSSKASSITGRQRVQWRQPSYRFPLLTSMEEEDLGFMYSCSVGCRF